MSLGGYLPPHLLESFDRDSGRLNVVIDTPRGSRCKYKYHEETGLFSLSKLLPLGACFPYNFGFVPSTRGEDGDALDALVLMEEPAFAGCLIPVLLIGVLEGRQTEKGGKSFRNDRLIGVVENEHNPAEVRSLEEVDRHRLDEIEHFFISYNIMEGRHFQPLGRFGPEAAKALVKQYGIAA